MAQLDKTITLDMVNFLTGQFETIEDRQRVINRAIPDCHVIEKLDFEIDDRAFAEHCIKTLMNHGSCNDALALVSVFNLFLPEVSGHQQHILQTCIHEIYRVVNAAEDAGDSSNQMFISYSRADSDIVMSLVADLRHADMKIWIDKEGITPGTPDWRQALRNAIDQSQTILLMASPQSTASNYVSAEIAVAQSAGIPVIPLWIDGDLWMDSAPLTLMHTQYIDMREQNYRVGLQDLIYTLRQKQTMPASDDDSNPLGDDGLNVTLLENTSKSQSLLGGYIDEEIANPYKALQPFHEEDAHQFYGRDSLIDSILTRFDNRKHSRFHAIAGASGSGKSSLVQAGIIPRLKNNGVKDSSEWVYLPVMAPAKDPLVELADCLKQHLQDQSISDISAKLTSGDARMLVNYARHISDTKVVLYIDQFEELFSQTLDDSVRRKFLDLIITSCKARKSNLIIFMTMRADFLQDILAYKDFAELVYDNLIPMMPMSFTDLADVIEKPAESVYVRFEEKLVANMLLDIWAEQAPLPILEFTLSKLFEQRQSHVMTLPAYERLGGIQNAISNHAEEMYSKLTPDQQQIARALFLRLVDLNDNGTITRKTISLSSLALTTESSTRILQYVADYFIEARLLTTGSELLALTDKEQDNLLDQPPKKRTHGTISLSHEALTHRWDRFAGWIQEYQAYLRQYAKINLAYRNWRDTQNDQFLLPEDLIIIARELESYYLLGREESQYVRTSMAYLQRLEEEELRLRRRNWTIASGVVVTIVASLIIVMGIILRDTERQREFTSFNAQAGWLQTRAPNMNGLPLNPLELTQTPLSDFYATATVQATQALGSDVEMLFEGVPMVYVPAGCFWMGMNGAINGVEISPVHEVCLELEFWIDRYEVTQQQVQQFANPADMPLDNNASSLEPVFNVTAIQAQDYCEARGARLPTEEEWEYAGRGPNSLAYTWGPHFYEGGPYQLFDFGLSLIEVNQIEDDVSWIGAVGMVSNIAEWTTSGSSFVLKGGYYADFNETTFLLAYREELDPDDAFLRTGFRCVRSNAG